MTKTSAFAVFEGAIDSPATASVYKRTLKEFMKFVGTQDHDEYVSRDPELIHDDLVSWLSQLKKKNLTKRTIRGKLSPVELLLEMNKVPIYKKILRKLLPSKTKAAGDVPFTTEEIEKMLSLCTKHRTRALVLFFASTGARPAAIEDPVLTLKHVQDMPNGCKSILIYEDSDEEYYSFLTPEASSSLDDYLNMRKLNGEQLTPDSILFTNYSHSKRRRNEHLSSQSVREIFIELMDKAGIERTKRGHRYDKATVYGFRKRFNGILKMDNSVNSNIAEKLMAHKNGLDGAYLKPTREECFEEFRKAIPELTINPSLRQEIKIKELEEATAKVSKMEDFERRLNEIENRRKESYERKKEWIGKVSKNPDLEK